MSERFYTPDRLTIGEYALTGPEAHHLAVVCRARPGDVVTLFNGDGHDYRAEVLGVSKNRVSLLIRSAEWVDRELPHPLVIASALPKGDRADVLVEKLTELGVTRFVPLITARSVVRPKPGTTDKFARVVVEASKQCGRNRLMVVDAPQPWDAFVRRQDLPPCRLMLHTAGGLPELRAKARTSSGVAAAVGPEGGFTPEEVAAAVSSGWQPVALGPRVLRVETAAIAVAALLALTPTEPRSA